MRLLIAVGETPAEDTPPPAVAALLAVATEIRVMSPSLVGPLQWLDGDVDEARRIADDRLTDMLGRLGPADASVTGVRGDELAGTALAGALRDFEADHATAI